MSPTNGIHDWRSIAEKACNEMDGEKLAHLIGELVRAIDEEHNERTQNSAKSIRSLKIRRLSMIADSPRYA